MAKSKINLIFVLIILILSCNSENKQESNKEEYINGMKEWRTDRLKKLKSPTGWLNLAGLYWIQEGINEFGSNAENKIVFPDSCPEFIGAVIKVRDHLSISVNDSIDVFVNDSLIKEYNILTDADGDPTIFTMGRYNWHFIKRSDKYALRLRDLKNPMIEKINDIPTFPIDTAWNLAATFNPFNTPLSVNIIDITGSETEELCYGSLTFRVSGKDYELLPLGDGKNDDLFIMFADGTSAKETYGGGRYLYVNKPDINGKTTIDFNKAVNPPCAFTEFATCPLPPKENILVLNIRAGEKIIKLKKE